MNKNQALEWLSAHIEGRVDPLDRELQEALRQAQSDPELRDWLDRQRRMDARIRDALRQEAVPGSLEESLLVAVGATPERKSVPWRRFLPWIAGLAALLVLGAGTIHYLRHNEILIQGLQEKISGTSPDSFENFRDGMAYYIRRVYFQLDHETARLPSIEAWLNQNKAPVYEKVPDKLAALKPLGCKELTWHERKVSLVCFNTRDGKIVHMFIMDRRDLDAGLYRNIGKVAFSSGLETGGWVTDGKVYLLVGSDPDVDIEFALG